MVGIGPTTFAIWGYCITKANNLDHTVILNPVLLAVVIGTTEEDIVNSINKLTSPDPVSKNPAQEGRRLLHRTGHLYFVVSHEDYRNIKNNEDRRRYMKEYMRDRRDVNNKVNKKLTKVNPASASDSASDLKSFLKRGSGGFKKPTAEEVTAYAKSMGIELDGRVFHSFYESNGWRVGKNPMKSWKGAVTGTWSKNNKQEKQNDTDRRRSEKASREFPEHIEIPTL